METPEQEPAFNGFCLIREVDCYETCSRTPNTWTLSITTLVSYGSSCLLSSLRDLLQKEVIQECMSVNECNYRENNPNTQNGFPNIYMPMVQNDC